MLEIPPILLQGEELISKGVEWIVVLRVLATLLPQALTLTIPMAVLLGILIAFGRLSGDREFVAMQACARIGGLEPFERLRRKLDGCLTGARMAKDRAANALASVEIPEQPDYPR